LGIYLLVFDHSHFTYIVFGLVFLGVSWFTRPRFGKLKKEEKIAARKEFPELYGMIDDLAVSMGTNKIDGIILDERYNASITKIGWRRKTIVRIGLPLFSALTPDEQCAILAHELGHYLNKDLTYGFYIGTALDTLAEWYDMLDPVDSDQQFEYTVIEMVTNIVMKAFSIIPYFLYFILLHLLWNDTQTGEYLADYRAAEMSGSDTTGKALEKVHYNDVFFHVLSKVSLRDDNVNVIDEFKRALDTMPEREKQRLKIRLGNEKFKLNTTHPPTTFRIQFVQNQNLPPRFTVDPERTQKIQAEFEAVKDKIHEEAVEDYRYYRLMI
jgi:Zn-dependent protease with chaperone function